MLRRFLFATALLCGCSSASFTTPNGNVDSGNGDSSAGATDAGNGTSDAASEAISTLPVTGDALPFEALPPGTGFCAGISPPPYLCADWDEGGPINAGFDHMDVRGGDVSFDLVAPYTRPAAYRSHLAIAGVSASAVLIKERPFSPSEMQQFTFAVRYNASCTSGLAGGVAQVWGLGLLPSGTTTPDYALAVYATAGKLTLVEITSSKTQSHEIGSLSPERYGVVGLSINPTGPTMTLSLEGTTSTRVDLGLWPNDVSAITTYAMLLGQQRTAPAGAECGVSYDNFVWY